MTNQLMFKRKMTEEIKNIHPTNITKELLDSLDPYQKYIALEKYHEWLKDIRKREKIQIRSKSYNLFKKKERVRALKVFGYDIGGNSLLKGVLDRHSILLGKFRVNYILYLNSLGLHDTFMFYDIPEE